MSQRGRFLLSDIAAYRIADTVAIRYLNPLTTGDCTMTTTMEHEAAPLAHADFATLTSLAWPDPTPEMLGDPRFNAIWQAIKAWDISVPGAYGGYCGATGNHVRAILDAIAKVSGPLVMGTRGPSAAEMLANPREVQERCTSPDTGNEGELGSEGRP
jgi:hypothetical protein